MLAGFCCVLVHLKQVRSYETFFFFKCREIGRNCIWKYFGMPGEWPGTEGEKGGGRECHTHTHTHKVHALGLDRGAGSGIWLTVQYTCLIENCCSRINILETPFPKLCTCYNWSDIYTQVSTHSPLTLLLYNYSKHIAFLVYTSHTHMPFYIQCAPLYSKNTRLNTGTVSPLKKDVGCSMHSIHNLPQWKALFL